MHTICKHFSIWASAQKFWASTHKATKYAKRILFSIEPGTGMGSMQSTRATAVKSRITFSLSALRSFLCGIGCEGCVQGRWDKVKQTLTLEQRAGMRSWGTDEEHTWRHCCQQNYLWNMCFTRVAANYTKKQFEISAFGRSTHYGPHCTVRSVIEDPPKCMFSTTIFSLL